MAEGPSSPERILITGAGGFVGRHLQVQLARFCATAALMLTNDTASPGVVALDVTDAAAVDAAVKQFRPDAVVHLAAISAIAQAARETEQVWNVNFAGTQKLARAVLRHAPFASFLFVSSAACYGRSFAGGAAISEAAPLEPIEPYAATKAAAEMALSAMVARGLKLIRLRPFTHIGPGQSPAFAVASFALQIARIEAGLQAPELKVGSLTPRRDLLDVRDVCAAYAQCLLHRRALEPGIAINLASGTARRIGDVVDQLLAEARVRIALRTDAARLRAADLEVMRGDASRAARLIGWRVTTPWSATLTDILAESRARVARDSR